VNRQTIFASPVVLAALLWVALMVLLYFLPLIYNLHLSHFVKTALYARAGISYRLLALGPLIAAGVSLRVAQSSTQKDHKRAPIGKALILVFGYLLIFEIYHAIVSLISLNSLSF
jgi:hypothetical protein